MPLDDPAAEVAAAPPRQAHFSPKPSVIVKRFEFNTRRQGEAESIAKYVAELRKLAQHCDYGSVLSDMLRDRLVCGVADKSIQRRLLQTTDLTFDKALEVALATEAADKDSRRLAVDKDLPTLIGAVKDRPAPSISSGKRGRQRVHRPQPGAGRAQSSRPSREEKGCSKCGGEHDQASCPFKHYECHNCKKKGHLAHKCQSRHSNLRLTRENTRFSTSQQGKQLHLSTPQSQSTVDQFRWRSTLVHPYQSSVVKHSTSSRMES